MSDPMMRVLQLDYLDRQEPGTPVELLGVMAEAFRNGWAAALAADRSRRKVVQIACRVADEAGAGEILALCDDGTILTKIDGNSAWTPLPPIPQPGEEQSNA